MSPPLRCHLQAPLLGVAFVQVPPLLGCHIQSLLLRDSSIQLLLLLRCHLQPPLLGATFLPPPITSAWCHLYSGATSSWADATQAWVLHLLRCHPQAGRDQCQCPWHPGYCCDAAGHHTVLGHPVAPFTFPSTHQGMSTLPPAPSPGRAWLGSKEQSSRRKTAGERFLPSPRVVLGHNEKILLHTVLGPVSLTRPQQPPLSAPPSLGWTKQPKASNAQQHPQGGIFFFHPLPPWAGTLFEAGPQEAAPAGALTTARLWGWDTSLSIPRPGHTAQVGT